MKIYTKRGDEGKTDVMGKRINKDSNLIEVLGSIDEAVSAIGLAKFKAPSKEKKILEKIQEDLMKIAGALACCANELETERVVWLEETIDKYCATQEVVAGFVLPGSDEYSGFLHLSRTIVRRAERQTVKLKPKNRVVLKYINRLSDLLFVIASNTNERS